jgi:hypothetical protein
MTATGCLPAGSRIGPFTIEALIGRGGMGEVYRAVHSELSRPEAVKILHPALAAQEEFSARFVREARVMQSLDHPSIVTVYDAGEAAGRLFLAMQLVTGRPLKDRLADGRFPTEATLDILEGIGRALDYAHSRGVIHRDIKPSNILLDTEDRPVLVDFGLAKALGDTSVTVSSRFLGTPTYMAPEQAAGDPVGHRADLYSLACVAFEMLTGEPPYTQQESLALLLAHSSQPVPRATEREPTLGPAVDAVFDRALAKSPMQRFPSAGAFVEALRAALGSPKRPLRRNHRRRMAWLAAALLALAAVVSGVLVLTSGFPGTRQASGRHAADSTEVPRGGLIYEARMDGTGASFVDTVGRSKDPAEAAVRFLPGRLELSALSPNGNAGTDLRVADGPETFVGDLDLSTPPGSDGNFCWGLRWAVPGQLAYQLCIDTTAYFAQLVVWNGENNVPITPRIPVPGLQGGHTVGFTVVVRDSQLTLFVDGDEVADVEDHQVPPSKTIPGLDVYSRAHSATVDVHAVRLYALAGG